MNTMKKLVILLTVLAMVLLCAVSCNNNGDGKPDGGDGGSSEGGNNTGNEGGDNTGNEGGDNTGNEGGDNTGNEGGDNTNPPAGDGDTEPEKPDYGKATVYLPGTTVNIVSMIGSDSTGRLKEALDEVLVDADGKGGAVLTTIYAQNADYEIVIDYVDETRPATVKAKRVLDRMDKGSYFECRYAIYAESGVIAIAFDRNGLTDINPIDYILDDFIESYVEGREYIASGEGLITSGQVDLIEKQEKIDNEYLAGKWTEFEAAAKEKYGEAVGGKIVDALRTYYSIFQDDLVIWYANLYDPGIGGFYATSSGRDSDGILPGIESTGQIMNALVSSGMLSTLGDSWAKNLPDIMKYRMIYFIKSTQNQNGYFYNPQMSMEEANAAISRRGRDHSRATSILASLGSAPTFTTPTGVTGDGITADEYWDSLISDGFISEDIPRPYVPKSWQDYLDHEASKKESLTSSVAAAVSRVITVASTDESEAYLQSHAAFAAYLDSKNLDAQPYSVGNELNATYKLIEPQSRKLGICTEEGFWYTGMTLKDMTIDWLNRHINDYGLFGNDYKPETADVLFANTNGLMKIITLYNEWEIDEVDPVTGEMVGTGVNYIFPEALKAARGCLTGIMSDEESKTNICETYNIWEALSILISNVKKNPNAEERELVLGEISRVLGELGPEAITNSYNRQKNYQKEGGGFSHRVQGSATAHQGNLIVGLGIDEADVDANGFGSWSIIKAMLKCFDLADYYVPIYSESDWMRFIDTVIELDPVIKYSYSAEEEVGDPVHLFDEIPSSKFSVTATNPANTASIKTVKGADGADNNVLYINKESTANAFATIFNPTVSSRTANMVVFEADLKYENVIERSGTEIKFGLTSGANKAKQTIFVYLTLGGTKNGSKILYTDYHNGVSKNQKIDTGAVVGEWFNLRIECYDGNLDTFRFRTYINDTLIYTSNSVWGTDYTSGASEIPSSSRIDRVSYQLNQANKCELYMDNVSFIQTSGTIDDMAVGKPGSAVVPDTPTTPDTPDTPAVKPYDPIELPAGIEKAPASDAVTFDQMPDINVTKVNISDTNNTATINNGVLYINKPSYVDSNSGVSITQYPTFTEDGATVAIFEADIIAAYWETANYIQITIGKSGDSPVFVLMKPNEAKLGSTLRVDSKETSAKVGSWFRLRVEYTVIAADESGVTEIECKIYVNNVLAETVNTIRDGKTAPTVDAIEYFALSFNAKNLGVFAIDNISFRKVLTSDYVEGEIVIPDPENPELENPEPENPDTDEPEVPEVLTFDEMPGEDVFKVTLGKFGEYTSGETTVTVIGENTCEIVTDGENKVLHISKGASGRAEDGTVVHSNSGTSMRVYVTHKDEEASVMVFEADIKVTNLVYNDVMQIHANDSSSTKAAASPLFGVFKFSGTADGSAIKNQSTNTTSGNTAVKVGEWFHLRVEYRVTETDTNGNVTAVETKYILGDGEPIICSTIYKTGVAVENIETLTFAFNSKNQGEFYVDNVSLMLLSESGEGDDNNTENPDTGEDETTDPETPEPNEDAVLTFEDMTEVPRDYFDFTVYEYASIVTEGNNKYLTYNKPSQGTYRFYLFSTGENVETADTVVFETDLLMDNDDDNGAMNIILTTEGDSTRAFLVELNMENGILKLNHKNQDQVLGTYTEGGASDGEWFKLKVVYTDDGSVKVYVKEELVLVSNNYYTLPGEPIDASLINTIYFVPFNNTVITIGMDNVAFYMYDSTVSDEGTTNPENPDTGEGEGGENPENPGTGEGGATDTENPGTGEGGATDTPTEPETPVDEYAVTFDEMPAEDVFKVTLGQFGEYTSGETTVTVVGENTCEIVTEGENKVLHISKGASGRAEDGTVVHSNSGTSMRVYVTHKDEEASVMVFEADIKVTNLVYNDVMQIHANDSSSTKAAASPLFGVFKFSGTADGSAIKNQSTNTTSGNTAVKVGEWFHLRVEYRVTETDTNGNVTAVETKYILGDGEPIICSTIYKTGVAVENIETLTFAFNSKNQGDFYVDNVSLMLLSEAEEGDNTENPGTSEGEGSETPENSGTGEG